MNELNFFEDGSPFLNHPLLTAERTNLEADFVEGQLGLNKGAAILDVGCGFGRHAIELAKRGYQVTAVDPAKAMIERGQADAAQANVSVQFHQMGGEQLQFNNQFDGVIALFTTLGQLSAAHGESSQALVPIFDALKPRGQFIVEVPQLETAVKHLKPFDQFGTDEQGTRIHREFDEASQIVTERFELYGPDDTRHFLLKYKLFSVEQLTKLITETGFTINATFGGYDQSPLVEDCPIMIVVGQK